VGNRLASVSTTSGGTQTRELHYDLRGFLLWEKHPELGASGNGTTVYGSTQTSGSYDAGGHAHRRVTGVFDLTTDYDAAERVTAVSETGARTLKLFAYDDPAGSTFGQCTGGKCKGKLAAAARYNYAPDLGTVAVTETYQYNGVGGLASRRDRTIGSSSTFDGQSFFFGQTNNDLGGVATITYPCRSDSNANCLSADRTSPAITMGYSAGTLTGVGSYASNITYQPNGVIGTVTHGSGSTAVSEVWDADANGMARPSTIRARNASNTELWNSGGYSFDGSGNIKGTGNTAYFYDAFDRLTGWKIPGTNGAYDWIGRRYDAFGNYLSAFEKVCMTQVSGQAQRCFTSNFATQQVTGTTNHYSGVTYDDAGNITTQSGRTFTWDSLGVMTGATANGRTFRYLYTADDERVAVVERVVGSDNITRNRTTWSARDFENRLLTTWTDDATSETRTITWKEDEIWRGGALLADVSSSGTKHYILDHLGSPRFITNASGQAVGPQNFAPFGSGGATGTGTLQFAGMERDLTAVGGTYPDLRDYDHHRFYDLDWGRFLSLDPVLGSPTNPQSWNRYVYVRNNPMNLTDPTGMQTGLAERCPPPYKCAVSPPKPEPIPVVAPIKAALSGIKPPSAGPTIRGTSPPKAPSWQIATFSLTAGVSGVAVGGGSAGVSLLKSTRIGTSHDGLAATGTLTQPGLGVSLGPYINLGAYRGDVADQRGNTEDFNFGFGNYSATLSWLPSGSFAGGSVGWSPTPTKIGFTKSNSGTSVLTGRDLQEMLGIEP
jgi:RHS repeat-associated protein